ncbi:MAG: NAD(P)-dependent oxidoreductase [Trebonia sp.]
MLTGLPNLRVLVCNGRTSNVVDHEARIERGILLCGIADTMRNARRVRITTGASGSLPSPSEMAWALTLAVAKRIGIEDREIRAGGWQTGFPVMLGGKTLGLLGAGRLGRAMVGVAKAFGMDSPGSSSSSPSAPVTRCAPTTWRR